MNRTPGTEIESLNSLFRNRTPALIIGRSFYSKVQNGLPTRFNSDFLFTIAVGAVVVGKVSAGVKGHETQDIRNRQKMRVSSAASDRVAYTRLIRS